MIVNDMIQEGMDRLKSVTQDYMIDAKNFASEVLGLDTTGLFMAGKDCVDSDQLSAYRAMVERRRAGEPYQYIVGHQAFMGLDFKVEAGVLIPRSDTEILVQAVLDRLKGQERVLDIGAGSGAIHCSLAHYKQELACVAVDISDIPLRVSRINAKLLGVDQRITYIKSDLYEQVEGVFDVIVSNPPYIKRAVVDTLQVELSYEPKLALDGGEDGYDFYRKIIEQGKEYLVAGGLMALEVGHDQGQGVKALLVEAGYRDVEIIQDYNHIERVVIARSER